MVKVIKPGLTQEDVVYTTTCYHCTCEFEFKHSEAKYNDNYDRSDQREGPMLNINCPTCGHQCGAAPMSPAEYLRKKAKAEGNGNSGWRDR